MKFKVFHWFPDKRQHFCWPFLAVRQMSIDWWQTLSSLIPESEWIRFTDGYRLLNNVSGFLEDAEMKYTVWTCSFKQKAAFCSPSLLNLSVYIIIKQKLPEPIFVVSGTCACFAWFCQLPLFFLTFSIVIFYSIDMNGLCGPDCYMSPLTWSDKSFPGWVSWPVSYLSCFWMAYTVFSWLSNHLDI